MVVNKHIESKATSKVDSRNKIASIEGVMRYLITYFQCIKIYLNSISYSCCELLHGKSKPSIGNFDLSSSGIV